MPDKKTPAKKSGGDALSRAIANQKLGSPATKPKADPLELMRKKESEVRQKRLMDSLGIKYDDRDKTKPAEQRRVVFKKPYTPAEQRERDKRRMEEARRGGDPVTLSDGTIYNPPRALGKQLGYDDEEMAKFNATDGGRLPLGMDGLGGGTRAVGSRIGGGKAAAKAAQTVVTAPFKAARRVIATGLQARAESQGDETGAATAKALYNLENEIRQFENRTGKDFYQELQKRTEENLSKFNDAVDNTIGRLGLGIGPVAGFLAKGAGDALLGAGQAQLELMDQDTDLATKARAAYAYGQGVATAGSIPAMTPGLGRAGSELARLSSGFDLWEPAFQKGVGAIGDAASKVDWQRVQAGFEDSMLRAGLNRPVLGGIESRTFDSVRRMLIDAGMEPETASAYAAVAGSRARTSRSDAFVPDVQRGSVEGGRAKISFGGDRPSVTLGEGADATSYGHEVFHAIRREMSPEELASVERAFGVRDGVWDVDAEERFAVAAERYLASGQMDRRSLGIAARRLARDFEGVYGSEFGRQNPEIDALISKRPGRRGAMGPVQGEPALAQTENELLQDELTSGQRFQVSTPEFKRWFGKSKIVDANGDPVVLYHQTARVNSSPIDTEGFDLSPEKAVARQSDFEMPDGIFLKPSNNDIGVGAIDSADNVQIKLFAKIESPRRFKNRDEMKAAWLKEIPSYSDLVKKAEEIDAHHSKIDDVLWANKPYDWDVAESNLAEWRSKQNAVASEMRKLITQHLQDAGHDGLILAEDVGSFGRVTETYVALKPTQVKSAKHNYGDFDPEKPGIMFQPNRVPDSGDGRLDPYSDSYDPNYSRIVDFAFGDGSAGSGVRGLAAHEERIAKHEAETESGLNVYREEIGRLQELHLQHQQAHESMLPILEAVESVVDRTIKHDVSDQAAASAGGESTSKRWKSMRRNRKGNWVPIPGEAKLTTLHASDFGDDASFLMFLDELEAAVASIDEGQVFVPLDKFNQFYTKGAPPKRLGPDWISRGTPSEMLWSDNVREDFVSGEKFRVTAPEQAVQKALSGMRSRMRESLRLAKAAENDLKAASADMRKMIFATHIEHERMIDEGIARMAQAERTYGRTHDADIDSFGFDVGPGRKPFEPPATIDATEIPPAPKATFKDNARNAVVENLSNLKRIDDESYRVARGLGASDAEANIVIKAVASQVDAKHGEGSFAELVPVLSTSRMIGIFDRYARIADEIQGMDLFDMAMKVNSGEMDAILEALGTAGRAIRKAANDAMRVGPGTKIYIEGHGLGVVTDPPKKSTGTFVQLQNGKTIKVDKTPTPVGWKDKLTRLRSDIVLALDDARANVGMLIASGDLTRGERFEKGTHDLDVIRTAVENARGELEGAKDALTPILDDWNRMFVPAIMDIHSRNQGIVTSDLGPLETYIPLMPKSKGETESLPLYGRDRLMFNRPDNPRNAFASGLATEYDTTVEGLREALQNTVRTNNKAELIDRLRTAGLLVDDFKWAKESNMFLPEILKGPDGEIKIVYADGTEVPAVMVPITHDRFEVDEFQKLRKVESKQAAVPKWLYEELRPAFEPARFSDNAVARALHAINAYGMVGLADNYFHAVNVIQVLRTVPYVSQKRVAQIAELIPGVAGLTRWMTSLVGTIRTVTDDDAALKELMAMARAGALPNRYGNETFSPGYAAATGAELKGPMAYKGIGSRIREKVSEATSVFGKAKAVLWEVGDPISFAPMLTGPRGLDTRARLYMWRIVNNIAPDATDIEKATFVNQMGAYNQLLSSQVERALKGSGTAPFFTAGSTMLRNGIRLWTGRTKMPLGAVSKSKAAELWVAQQIAGGAVGALSTWAILYKAMHDMWPWEDEDTQFLQVPIPDKIRDSDVGKKIWGDKPGRTYVNMAFFLGTQDRGARALGIKGAYDTWSLGGNMSQISESALAGMLNGFTHPVTSSPVVKTALQMTLGSEPYVSSFRDRETGAFGVPQMIPATPTFDTDLPFAQPMANVGYGFLDLNQFVGGTIRLGLKAANAGEPVIPQTDFERQQDEDKQALMTVLGYAFPRLLSTPKQIQKKKDAIQKERKTIERRAAKDRGDARSRMRSVDSIINGDVGDPTDRILRKLGI